MKVMLLAAGLGTRLRPVTDTLPKPLIPINGLPLIFYNLALLKKHGLTDVVINLHHLGDQIKDLLGNGKDFGFHFRYSFEKTILGTGGGILKARPHFKKESFLVMNGDIIADFNLKPMLQSHSEKKSMATLAVISSPLALKAGPVYIDSAQRIRGILEKPDVRAQVEPTLFSGIHIVNPLLLEKQKKGFSCIVRQIYRPAIANHLYLKAYRLKGYWSDLGTFDTWKKTDRLLKQHKLKLSYQNLLDQFKFVLMDKKNYSPPKCVEL